MPSTMVKMQVKADSRVTTAAGAVLWLVAAVGYLILEALAAAGFEPTYSYAQNYVSDLGVTGGGAYLMRAAFFLQGILFLLGALLIVRFPDSHRGRLFLGLVAANAVGNIVVGTVHSGKVHVVGAALAIVGGNAAILAGSALLGATGGHRWYRGISELVAALGLLCLIMLLINSVTGTANLLPTGAWERGSIYSITLWQLLTGGWLLGRCAPGSNW
jgi:hypothetical membrane protein